MIGSERKSCSGQFDRQRKLCSSCCSSCCRKFHENYRNCADARSLRDVRNRFKQSSGGHSAPFHNSSLIASVRGVCAVCCAVLCCVLCCAVCCVLCCAVLCCAVVSVVSSALFRIHLLFSPVSGQRHSPLQLQRTPTVSNLHAQLHAQLQA